MVSSYNLGAVRTTEIANVKVFGFTYQESDDFTPFELAGVDYVVPASKQIVMSFMNLKTGTGSGTTSMGYADNATGTNYVTLAGVGAIQPTSSTYHTCELPLVIPAGKYPLLKQTVSGQGYNGTAVGLLEAV
jgi:hypothetical protein